MKSLMVRIRYDNESKKFTAYDAPDWIKTDQQQTVFEIRRSRVPEDFNFKFYRFGTLEEPFVSIEDQVRAEEKTKADQRKDRKKAVLKFLNVPDDKASEFIQGLRELLADNQ